MLGLLLQRSDMITMQERKRLMRAIKNLVKAEIENSWKGGGNPDDIPAIENRLKRAQYHMLRTINELAELKEVIR
jgi:alanine-alpha-ketoisovalerate/valine-pyruvate aminotransferase